MKKRKGKRVAIASVVFGLVVVGVAAFVVLAVYALPKIEVEAIPAYNLSEDRLESPAGDVLARLPAHRAFWFGWYAAYPRTRLVH